MAAINRALFPQLSPFSIHYFTKCILESSRRTLNARYASRISSLQPVFPEKQDDTLFEDSGNEYASIDAKFRLFHKPIVKTYPCDALAAAAIERNEALASTLLKEYRQAGVEVLLRPEYEELANLNLADRNFGAFMGWLALVPPVGGASGVIFPKNTNMVEQMSRIRLPFDQMYRLLYLFGRKGWSGPVPSKLVTLLAKYTNPAEFTRLLSEVMSIHLGAHGSSEEVRWIHAEWRNRAIQEYSKRNDPETAFHILAQSPQDVVEFEPKVIGLLDQSTRRMLYPIPPFASEMLKTTQLPPPRNPLRSSDITKHAFKLLFHRQDTVNPEAYTQSTRQTAILIGKLKHLLTTPHKGTHIDPKAFAFLFYSLTYSPHSLTRPGILSLFRKRVARLGSDTSRVLWATIEVELLHYRGDSHAAVVYFNQAFLPIAVPFFLRTRPVGHWENWMSKEPLLSLPPVPPMPLRPSAVSIMAIWKAAIKLSTRDPDVVPTGHHSLFREHAYLRQQDSNEAVSKTTSDGGMVVKFDVSHLTHLFNNFLAIFDQQVTKQRTFFSNPFTRVRFFEIFLRHYVAFAPEMCAWVMAQIQQRDVPLDHRIWAIYAKSKVDAGDPGFLLRVFELLQEGAGEPLDFSPRALKNWSTDGIRWDGGEGEVRATRFTLPSKVLSAYIYGFRQLLNVKAYKEALELHSRIIKAGYREGTSIAFDRLVFRMLEELKLVMRHGPRVRVRSGQAELLDEMVLDEGEEERRFDDVDF